MARCAQCEKLESTCSCRTSANHRRRREDARYWNPAGAAGLALMAISAGAVLTGIYLAVWG